MNTIKLKTAALAGAALRYAVAKACGWKLERIEDGDWKEGEPHWWQAINEKAVVPGKRNGLVGYIVPGARGITSSYDYCPDVDWSIGGRLIDHFNIDLTTGDAPAEEGRTGNIHTAYYIRDTDFLAFVAHGSTRLIAACKVLALAHFGDEVDVPAELVEGGGA